MYTFIVFAFPPFSFVLIENKNLAPIILHVLETRRLDYKAESLHYGCWLLISVHVFEKGLFVCLLPKVKGKV